MDPRRDCVAYDLAAEEAGIQVGTFGWQHAAEIKLGFPRPFGPNRNPSPRCESGKRRYCTCDTCF
jgi:hypothetical protein